MRPLVMLECAGGLGYRIYALNLVPIVRKVASTLETIIQPPMPVAHTTSTISRKNSMSAWFFESKRFFQKRDSFRLKLFTAASHPPTLRGRVAQPHAYLENVEKVLPEWTAHGILKIPLRRDYLPKGVMWFYTLGLPDSSGR